jgi:cell division protein FtsL
MTDGTRAGRASRAALATVIPLRAPEREQRPSLRVVPAGLRRRRTAVVTILAMAVMFSVMLGLAAFQTIIAQGQARLDRLDTDVRNAQSSYQKLRFDVAQLEAPARIVATARDRLGMVVPDSVSYLAPTGDAALEAEAAAVAHAGSKAPLSDANASEPWTQLKPYVGSAP